MSHEVNTQNPSLEPAATAVVDPSQVPFLDVIPEADHVMDESADGVMDDVFEDVERILREGGLPHDIVPPAPKPNPLASLASMMPSLLSPKPAGPPEFSLKELDGNDVDDLATIATEVNDLAALETATPAAQITQKSFDQLLLTLAGISVLLTGGLWMMAQIFWKDSPTVVATAPTEAVAVASEADREFLSYMERSLDVLNRKAEITEQNTAVAGNAALPNVTVAGNTSEVPPTVLDRVYVPVYQTPQTSATTTAAPTGPIQPNLAQAPVASVAPAATPSPTTTGEVPNIAAAPSHTLVGLLELGDRSAALFEVGGTAQRIELGEMIGTSGWILVSVSNQEALIRRNGEVRSVYVGQQF